MEEDGLVMDLKNGDGVDMNRQRKKERALPWGETKVQRRD